MFVNACDIGHTHPTPLGKVYSFGRGMHGYKARDTRLLDPGLPLSSLIQPKATQKDGCRENRNSQLPVKLFATCKVLSDVYSAKHPCSEGLLFILFVCTFPLWKALAGLNWLPPVARFVRWLGIVLATSFAFVQGPHK